jgi:hypothetical protein
LKRLLRLILPFVLVALAVSQTAIVKRSVTLRPDASTDNDAITTLKPGTRAKVLRPTKKNGYLFVSVRNQKGWIRANAVDIDESDTETASDDDDFSADTSDPSGDEENTENCIEGTPTGVKHVGPAKLYPDPDKTPGCAATLNLTDLTKRYTENCPKGKADCTYSQAHRRVSSTERTLVYVAYEVPSEKRNGTDGEVDHFYPLCAGGSNDEKNLWYQPAENKWNGKNLGFHEKDALERYICKEIKDGRMDPKDAFERLTKDWVKFYLDEGLDQ